MARIILAFYFFYLIFFLASLAACDLNCFSICFFNFINSILFLLYLSYKDLFFCFAIFTAALPWYAFRLENLFLLIVDSLKKKLSLFDSYYLIIQKWSHQSTSCSRNTSTNQFIRTNCIIIENNALSFYGNWSNNQKLKNDDYEYK